MSDIESPLANHPLPQPRCVFISDRVMVRISGPGPDQFLQGPFTQQNDHAVRADHRDVAECPRLGRLGLVDPGDEVQHHRSRAVHLHSVGLEADLVLALAAVRVGKVRRAELPALGVVH